MKLNIIKDNETNYCICIPKNASECNEYASEELQKFIQSCTNVELEIIKDDEIKDKKIISLGNTSLFKKEIGNYDFSAFGTDGFIIKAINGNILINGNTDRSVLFGVYDLLEKFLNIRFVAVDTTYMPKTDIMQIPSDIDIVEIPSFPIRGYLESSMFNGDDFIDYDFALRKRVHSNYVNADLKHGGRCAYWGRNNTCHNFHYYVRPEIYNNPKDKENYHPEFFTYWKEDGGMASAKEDEYGVIAVKDVTICLTNGITDDGKLDETMDISVAKIVIEELKKDIIANPDIVYFDFSQEDGLFYCNCEKCKEAEKKYKRSGILIRFCNVIATELQKWADKELNGRKIYIVTFGYIYTAYPPLYEKNGKYYPLDKSVELCDNVVMRLAMNCNNYYSYFDDRQFDDVKNKLAQWKILSNRFFLWTYSAFFDRYQLFFPCIQTIDENIKGFKKYGVEYYMINGAYNSPGLWQDIMKAYIYQAKMWNENLDTNQLIDEFLYHYFGEIGSQYVKEFMKMHFNHFSYLVKEKGKELYTFQMKDKEDYPLEFLLKTNDLILKAREEVKLSVKDEEKANLYDKHLAQVQLSSVFPLCEHYLEYYPEKTEEDYIKYAKDWVKLCKYAGVTRYHEQIKVQNFVDDKYKFPY